MAGLIARLFGGQTRPPDTEPAPGIGGVSLPPGPAGQTGFPGSTAQTRTFRSNNPRHGVPQDWTGVKSDTNTGIDNALSSTPEVRQASYRADQYNTGRGMGQAISPRATPRVVTPKTAARDTMQNNSPAEFFGGPMLHTGPGNNTAGGEPGSRAAAAGGHNARETTTLWKDARVVVSENTPGAQNVRNEFAQRYKNAPGGTHTYRSAPRADQAPVNQGGQATDGNVNPNAVVEEVTVQNRFVMNPGNGVISWSVTREMPYGGRGNGARGADLNGQRYYAAGQSDQFFNAGQGDYGIARFRGGDVKRPVSFTEPAPWTSQFYDSTDDIENQSAPQAASQVYISPAAGRASNSTGRTG